MLSGTASCTPFMETLLLPTGQPQQHLTAPVAAPEELPRPKSDFVSTIFGDSRKSSSAKHTYGRHAPLPTYLF